MTIVSLQPEESTVNPFERMERRRSFLWIKQLHISSLKWLAPGGKEKTKSCSVSWSLSGEGDLHASLGHPAPVSKEKTGLPRCQAVRYYYGKQIYGGYGKRGWSESWGQWGIGWDWCLACHPKPRWCQWLGYCQGLVWVYDPAVTKVCDDGHCSCIRQRSRE